MNKYTIRVHKTLFLDLTVEADTIDDALDQVNIFELDSLPDTSSSDWQVLFIESEDELKSFCSEN
jgi:hypothetical protein